ncbi:hypothetical protein JOC37_001297 [Desulfohalotomaculum tongense]|uniref:hypothetical protein n=1 Tax=Desulforadius tongensis TaxID=1216062 RepID=UPI001958A5B7|nr:hypothetical protein [Desulforadius tongensis]MBM7854917.1 hypothetical protein [Desulforadius tongensis]
MLCNYDSDYFLESIESIEGRRYSNIKKPLVNRNISKDDVAGFFRIFALAEEHKSVLKIINQFQIADTDMIISGTGLKFNRFKKIKEFCIITGLIFENHIKTEDREYFWYMVDTGGVYALDDMGEKYNSLPFTLSLEQKYKLYLKANFVFTVSGYFTMIGHYKVKDRNGQVYNIELLEDVKVSKIPNYRSTIFLVNRKTLDALNINKYAKNLAKQLNGNENKFFDVNQKQFLNIMG